MGKQTTTKKRKRNAHDTTTNTENRVRFVFMSETSERSDIGAEIERFKTE